MEPVAASAVPLVVQRSALEWLKSGWLTGVGGDNLERQKLFFVVFLFFAFSCGLALRCRSRHCVFSCCGVAFTSVTSVLRYLQQVSGVAGRLFIIDVFFKLVERWAVYFSFIAILMCCVRGVRTSNSECGSSSC